MIKTALSRKRTRAVYFFFVSLSDIWIRSWRRRTIWWESGWWFPLSSLGARSAMMIKNKVFHNSDNLGYQTTRALLWLLETFLSRKRPSAPRERRTTLCPGKRRERYKKNTRSALLPSLLQSRAKFSDDDVKKWMSGIWCSKWLKVHYLLSRKAERTKIDRTTKRQNTARVKGNFHTTKILIFNHFFLYF